MSLIQDMREALANPSAVDGARAALAMVKSWCDEGAVSRLPGCGTLERLALRIHRGATVEQAAAKEYAYRWSLPLRQWINYAETDSRADRAHRLAHRRITGRAAPCRMGGAWPVPHLIGM